MVLSSSEEMFRQKDRSLVLPSPDRCRPYSAVLVMSELLCSERMGDTEDEPRAEFDPVLMADYRVLQNMLALQHSYMPKCDYFKSIQSDLEPYMRKVVADWMLEVCEEQHCEDQVFSLALNFVDRFLCTTKISRQQFQLLGAVSLLTASKLRQCRSLNSQLMIYYTDYSITLEELKISPLLLITNLSPHFFEIKASKAQFPPSLPPGPPKIAFSPPLPLVLQKFEEFETLSGHRLKALRFDRMSVKWDPPSRSYDPFLCAVHVSHSFTSVVAGNLNRLNWELLLLSRLKWDLSAVTAFDFVDVLLERLGQFRNSTLRRHCHTFISLAVTGVGGIDACPRAVEEVEPDVGLSDKSSCFPLPQWYTERRDRDAYLFLLKL
ncbi:unnamed protein product [Cyprideis torosa]|uniref:Cyclin-like domain-containing protein n=1 Tax=Cyprideis torosa TaxID=163714 RepID=A0A7R8W4C3_9CRUS|nr:unnamed protein product [Cyprideis torosa]CAG0884049.1 unnamed protein product [Cyprideis torosa]